MRQAPWIAAAAALGLSGPAAAAAPATVRVLVMDPMAKQNACACVAGYAQRDYSSLARRLTVALGRPVQLTYHLELDVALQDRSHAPDIVIGKRSVVQTYGARARTPLTLVADLTDKGGLTTQQGLFVVRAEDAPRALADLSGKSILFGTQDAVEKNAAAVAALRNAGVDVPKPLATRPSCTVTATALMDREADAGVVSGYALPLLQGCGTIPKGALRVVGKTAPVPFIGVFVVSRLPVADRAAVTRVLLSVSESREMLRALESRRGFVLPASEKPARSSGHAAAPPGWTDWRGGPRRDGLSLAVPASLPADVRVLWRRSLTGQSLGGLTADDRRVIVSDKSADRTRDIWRCLDARSGATLWEVAYDAPGDMDYTNAPRASPVISGGAVFLLGAFGRLTAADLVSGHVRWTVDLGREPGARPPTWGLAGTPIVADGRVVVSTGSPVSSLMALRASDGTPLWRVAGRAPGYGSFILATLGGVRQLVGHDVETLGGWDPATGRRLWTLRPPAPRDFNVPTPVVVGGNLLVATENNGTRLYAFDRRGRIVPRPVAANQDLRPTTPTPVVVGGLVWGACDTGLYALDLAAGLKTAWRLEEPPFTEHVSLIGGRSHVLVSTMDGRLALLPARPGPDTHPQMAAVFGPAGAGDRAVWSHPALVGDRIYLRSDTEVVCVSLAP